MLDRFQIATNMQKYENVSVLDLGCRDKVLKNYLKSNTRYKGIDFYDDNDVIKHNLEDGIPFDDNSVDVVFALDVVEHVENIHFLLLEMLRVAKNEIIIALSNMYHYSYRLKYLMGKEISIKFRLPLKKELDRHRWLTYYNQYDSLIRNIFMNCEINEINQPQHHRRFLVLNMFDKMLINKYPQLVSFTTFYRISKVSKND